MARKTSRDGAGNSDVTVVNPCPPRHRTIQLGVLRDLIVWVLGLMALVVATLACGGPNADVAPGSPAAQATATRRAAINEVQRMIASHPTSTPAREPTETPAPTCRNAIWWTDARAHVGESRTVQGTIVATRTAPGGVALLEIGQPYPDPTGLSVIVPSAAAAPAMGTTVCAAGSITIAEGRLVLQPSSPNSIQAVQSAR